MTMSANPTPEEIKMSQADLAARQRANDIVRRLDRGVVVIGGNEDRGWDVISDAKAAHPSNWAPKPPEPDVDATLEALKNVDRAAHRLAEVIRTGHLADVLEELSVWTDACNALVDSYLP